MKTFLICLNPQFSMPFHCRAWSVAQPSFRESRVAVADDVYQGTKHNGASVSSLYLLEKMESNTNRSKSFVSESYLFRHWSSELSFNSKGSEETPKDSDINYYRARSTNVNLLLRALRAICIISSDHGEDTVESLDWRNRHCLCSRK